MFDLDGTADLALPQSAIFMPRPREERQRCWDARDAYYACLNATGVVVPGEESSKQCRAENKAFVKNCAKSWVEYFNKRRVLADQQKELLEAAQKQHAEVAGNGQQS